MPGHVVGDMPCVDRDYPVERFRDSVDPERLLIGDPVRLRQDDCPHGEICVPDAVHRIFHLQLILSVEHLYHDA